MKDIMQKLAELEATAPKITKKKMLKEDSATPPINVSNKPASLKDVFAALSENVAPGQKPLPVLDPQNKQAGMGFVTSNNPSVQNMLKNLDPKDVQIVQAPGQPGQQPQVGQQQQATAAGQPNPNQLQAGQQAMQEVDMGQAEKGTRKSTSHIKGYKVVDSSGKVISKHKGQRDAIQAALKNDDYSVKAIKEKKLDELSPNTLKSYAKKADIDQVGINRELKNRYHTGLDPELMKKSSNRTQGMKLAGDKMMGRAKVPANEGAKVDRMVKHIEKSERGLGKSKDKASDIAWATANKRGMLDNKNKKKVKEADLPSTAGVDTMGAGLGAGRSATTLEGKDEGKPGKNFAKIAKSAGKRYGSKEAGERVAGAVKAKLAKQGKLEEAKPDFLDLDKDGNKKEPMKKAAADKKKKVKESMNHRISAARLEGKSHGLRGHAHSGKRYEDLEEMRAYHEGYKEGLDECYGQGVYETAPAMPAATVPGMASAAMPTMEDDMEEGNAFTAALAKTPKGGKFSVGGKTFTDKSSIEEYAFESLDQQLNALLNESDDLSEGLSVSISKGQQNSPDSVTITAQDAEAEHLLAFVKNAGLGLFGDDSEDTHSSAMSVQPSHGAPDEIGAGGAEIGVVDGHDGMMGLMQKLSGIQSDGADDYADDGDEEQLYGNHEEVSKKDCGCDGDCECSDYDQPSNEETCNECGGMMEAGHSCGSKEMVDEVETEDQEEFEVAEDNAPDSETAEHNADEEAEAEEDSALAQVAQQNKTNTVNEGGDGGEASEEGAESKEGETDEEGETVSESFANLFKKLAFIAEESTEKEDEKAEKAEKDAEDEEEDAEDLTEWANQIGDGPGKGTDASFEQDIDFMTKVISGGLNKPKSTGQTTVPVIAGQDTRMHDNPLDWATLAGIRKA